MKHGGVHKESTIIRLWNLLRIQETLCSQAYRLNILEQGLQLNKNQTLCLMI